MSHGDSKASKRNAARQNSRRLAIEGYPNWEANGHYELSCKCGAGHVWKEIGLRRGKPVIRTGGDCPSCGRITITAGAWRKAKNPARFVRCMPGEQDKADQAFGNPFTYNDPMAEVYGRKRFAHHEGMNGVLVSRFQLIKGKRWFRRRDQARTDCAMVFSIMHALAIEQRRRAAAGSAGGGGGSPPARAAA